MDFSFEFAVFPQSVSISYAISVLKKSQPKLLTVISPIMFLQSFKGRVIKSW